MKLRHSLWIVGFLSLALVSSTFSQPLGSAAVSSENYDKLFNPQTVENLKGKVVGLETLTAGRGHQVHASLVFMRLKTDKETIEVYLGPQPYLDKQKVKLAANDQVMVKGSRVNYEGKPLIIAMGVRKGRQGMRLRNKQGIPMWGRVKKQ